MIDNPDAMREQNEVLKHLKQKTQALVDCKASLLQKTESLDVKKSLLEEMVAERQRLLKEKKMLLDMLQTVQRDIDTVFKIEESLSRERDDLEQSVTQIRANEYEPLHEMVNDIREKKGLQKLPHIQQELEAQLARILEERREGWQHQGDSTASTSPPHWPQPVPSETGSSRRRTAPTNSRSRSKKRRQ